MSKVFIFGIDGAFPEYVFGKWLDELPNIKKVLEKSKYGIMNSTIPPLSATAWSSIYTGKNPSDTGIFEYIYRKNHSYEEIHLISSKKLKEKTIWQIASEQGKKSIVCFPLLTWPIKPFDGILISGTLTPSGKDVDCTYPKELKQEIKEKLGEVPMPDIPNFRNLTKEEIIEEVYKMTRKHINIMKYLIQNKEWDLFFGVINMSDRLHHMFWRYLDEKHRKHDPESKFKNVIKDFYVFLDKELGNLLELLDKDTKIILISDHGITRMHTRVNLTDWLIKEGYLVLKEPIKEKAPFKMSMVDWEKTRVFAIGAYEGQVYINLKGREPQGIIETGEEYNALLLELETKLKQIPGDDGKEMDTKVFVKKRDYNGKLIEEAPDMIVYFDNLEYGCNSTLIGNETLWSPSTAKGSDDATHSKKGIFSITNSNGKEYLGDVNYLDIAPTILKELNIKIPEDLKGKII